MSSFADLMANVVALEQQVAAAVAKDNPTDEPRVYEWRPSGVPELPCIFNWIEDGTYEIVDTGRADDVVVLRAVIGVKPSDLAETMGRLMRLTDTFRAVVDPALDQKRPLGVREAKRVVTRSHIEEFNGVPVMCMEMLIRCRLDALIREGA